MYSKFTTDQFFQAFTYVFLYCSIVPLTEHKNNTKNVCHQYTFPTLCLCYVQHMVYLHIFFVFSYKKDANKNIFSIFNCVYCYKRQIIYTHLHCTCLFCIYLFFFALFTLSIILASSYDKENIRKYRIF